MFEQKFNDMVTQATSTTLRATLRNFLRLVFSKSYNFIKNSIKTIADKGTYNIRKPNKYKNLTDLVKKNADKGIYIYKEPFKDINSAKNICKELQKHHLKYAVEKNADGSYQIAVLGSSERIAEKIKEDVKIKQEAPKKERISDILKRNKAKAKNYNKLIAKNKDKAITTIKHKEIGAR